MKFMRQLNPGAVKTFNLPPESQFLIWRPAVATLHEGRNGQRHGHESFSCVKAFGLCEEDPSGRSHGGLR